MTRRKRVKYSLLYELRMSIELERKSKAMSKASLSLRKTTRTYEELRMVVV